MQISGATVLLTGANRGLGRQLLDQLLSHGARRVYAAVRAPDSLPRIDERVVPVTLDLTDREQVAAVAQAVPDTTVLVNNAGTASFADPLTAERDGIVRELSTNYLGTLDLIRAVTPVIEHNGGGAVVNVLSVVALAGHPPMAGYAASKAAMHSMTQALRPVLARRGITVHGVFPAGIDTEMIADVPGGRSHPREVAEGVIAGLLADEEDIFPDPISRGLSPQWFSDPKSYERAFSGR